MTEEITMKDTITDDRKEVALFRFGMISEALHLPPDEAAAAPEAAIATGGDDPGVGPAQGCGDDDAELDPARTESRVSTG